MRESSARSANPFLFFSSDLGYSSFEGADLGASPYEWSSRDTVFICATQANLLGRSQSAPVIQGKYIE